MAEKALKFAKKTDRSWDGPEVDRSNMLLFPTIASCTSSDSEEGTKSGDVIRESSKDTGSLKRDGIAKAEDVVNPDVTIRPDEPSQHAKHHHHHRHRHHKQYLVSYQTLAKYSVISEASWYRSSCHDLASLICHDNGVLELGAATVVLGGHRPAIIPHERLAASFHQHRFNGEHLVYSPFSHPQHTLHHLAAPLVLEVEDVRKHVHVATDSVAAIIAHARGETATT